MREIDCRGLDCPGPVISTKKALEESGGQPFKVLLDNGAARENVLRFCSSRGCTVNEESLNNSTSLEITCNLQPRLNNDKQQAPVILVTSDCIGNGPDELGRLLLKNFIITLLELQTQPEKIVFVNRGVLLTSEGSELLEPLGKLVDSGVEILSCGICLEYFGKSDKLMAGTVTNMYTIAESLLLAGNTIRL